MLLPAAHLVLGLFLDYLFYLFIYFYFQLGFDVQTLNFPLGFCFKIIFHYDLSHDNTNKKPFLKLFCKCGQLL